ncbi:Plug domain-containing protein [Aliarcobacter cryaerophilus]|uniref:Plug domain-containing protein n=1 Tax=Aliarcobacter cryaerophilus TaxID=28198 RepID=UPI0021B531E2|nr:Plug domain-containing protein [Aliarcobacter cryaerophilus]MCT7515494.1 Plug domain-containing protein [Aliarcobacter cryaerophilus]
MYLKKLILFFSFTISSFSQELGNLLDNLNNYTDKTNLNIDYKPSAMTVLYASDLESLGINTLGEALDFVAGIQTFKTTSIGFLYSKLSWNLL